MFRLLLRIFVLGLWLVNFNIVLIHGQKCNNIDLKMAEESFMTAFALEFNTQKMPPEAQLVIYCLKNKTESISLKQIPRCLKPRYCLLCRAAMHTMIRGYKAALTNKNPIILKQTLMKILVGLCQVAEFSQDYCLTLANTYLDSINEILQKNPSVTPDEICSMPLAPIGCAENKAPKKPIRVNLSAAKPSGSVKCAAKTTNPMKILHITDVHYDPAYVENEESPEYRKQCERTFGCCRNGSSSGTKRNRWGSYHFCDTPKSLIESSLNPISEQHFDAKLVYLTGDLVRHHVPEVNLSTLKADSKFVFQKFMQAFEGRSVVFAIGNHDTNVFGMFAPYGATSGQRDVYEFYRKWVTKLWKNGPTTRKDIEWPKDGEGYYTVELECCLRLIVLNPNVAYFYNWWLLTGHFYGKQLQWLQDVLAKAESVGQKVHILSHIPPNHHSLVPEWSKQYRSIVNRYKNTIVAQFNGHSHNDEFVLFYDKTDPTSVAWNAGSFTPHAYNNPNYHVITVVPDTFEVSNRESYSLDLAKANELPEATPQWKLTYNMAKEYGLPDLTLASLNDLVNRMVRNETLTELVLRNKLRNSPRLLKALTPECRESTICDILTTALGDASKCKKVTNSITWTRNKGKICTTN